MKPVKGKVKPIAVVPLHNTKGKKDVTGAFLPEAVAFLNFHTGKSLAAEKYEELGLLVRFDNTLPVRERVAAFELAFSDARKKRTQLPNTVAFFCHGYKKGLQTGHATKNVNDLAGMIADTLGSTTQGCIPLYACSTAGGDSVDAPGEGDGSFADALRDALCSVGVVNCRVMAHSTVGHTTKNPNVMFFDGDGSSTTITGGYPPVNKTKKQAFTQWRHLLQNLPAFRFSFPMMDLTEISKAISGELDD